jgi:class 3 adenylate cyclase
MARYFEEMKTAVERHGGTVEKFIGDAVMAVFGIPNVHEDDALRAVRAAQEMRERLEALNHELERDWGVVLRVRIGVNTGEVVAGTPASGQTLVTGDSVNVAARLEQAAEPGEILIGQTTHQLTRDAVRAEPLDPLLLKGKGKPSTPSASSTCAPTPPAWPGVWTRQWWDGLANRRF